MSRTFVKIFEPVFEPIRGVVLQDNQTPENDSLVPDLRFCPERNEGGPARGLNVVKEISRPFFRGAPWILAAVALGLSFTGLGRRAVALQPPTTNSDDNGSISGRDNSLLSIPPRAWVVDAVENELKVLHRTSPYLRYHMRLHDEKGDRLRDVIESKDGSVARLIMRDGRPLTADEDKAERDRLNALIQSPATFAKHIKAEENNKKLGDDLMKLMPDAMIYTYVPGQPQLPNYKGTTIVLDYEPNPKFNPPTTTSEALRGLKGRAWIDAKERQVVRMEGTVFQPVNLGWGILAHIYPGGKLVLDQTNAGAPTTDRWIFTHFNENLTVRALMMKTIKVHANIDGEQFQIVPEMSYQDAIKTLLNTPLPAH